MSDLKVKAEHDYLVVEEDDWLAMLGRRSPALEARIERWMDDAHCAGRISWTEYNFQHFDTIVRALIEVYGRTNVTGPAGGDPLHVRTTESLVREDCDYLAVVIGEAQYLIKWGNAHRIVGPFCYRVTASAESAVFDHHLAAGDCPEGHQIDVDVRQPHPAVDDEMVDGRTYTYIHEHLCRAGWCPDGCDLTGKTIFACPVCERPTDLYMTASL